MNNTKNTIEQANDLIENLNKEFEYTDTKCRLMCYEAAKFIESIKIFIGKESLEGAKWKFVPDNNGGHMLDIETGIKWYPENKQKGLINE